MTEPGEKWAKSQRDQAVSYQTPNEEVSFWLRAFCDEILKRAETIYQKQTAALPGFKLAGSEDCIRLAFTELKRELLGEESK